MAGSRKESDTEYVLKKGGNEVQIVPCKGWFDPCEYCDKRFGEWVPVDEEVYEKIPDKPGFATIALKNKNTTEVVSILYDQSNIQKKATLELDSIKDEISNKKSKATKSSMLVRWMVIKKNDDKENTVLCAHWQNNGVLPKFIRTWPGKNLLEDSKIVEFSKHAQKWCYRQKDPVWRKAKPPSSKILEEVKKCNFQSCEICDSYLTPWQPLSDVIENNSSTMEKGLVMLSVVCGKNREVIRIPIDRETVAPIKSTINSLQQSEKYYLSKFQNKNPRLEVRWMTVRDPDSDNSCFLYAHWLNADKRPEYNQDWSSMPGESSLDKNKHFVYRTNDKKWFYEVEAFKQAKFSKAKNKRRIFEELADQEYEGEEA